MVNAVTLLDMLSDAALLWHLAPFTESKIANVQVSVWFFSECNRRDKDQFKWGLETMHWCGRAVDFGSQGFAPVDEPPRPKVYVDALDESSDEQMESRLFLLERGSGVWSPHIYAEVGTDRVVETCLPLCSHSLRKLFGRVVVRPQIFERDTRSLGAVCVCNPLRSREYVLHCGDTRDHHGKTTAGREVRKWGEQNWGLPRLCVCGLLRKECARGVRHCAQSPTSRSWSMLSDSDGEAQAEPDALLSCSSSASADVSDAESEALLSCSSSASADVSDAESEDVSD